MASTYPGRSFPIGAQVSRNGVNFCVYSRGCTAMDLLLFDRPSDLNPARVIALDPKTNCTYNYWHVFVPGLKAGQLYAYRVDGPYDPDLGLRFDRGKALLDPYGRSLVFPRGYNRNAASLYGERLCCAPKSVVVDPSSYDWDGDLPLNRPFSRTIIYEMHVAGFTKNPNSDVDDDRRGTYAGLIEKIPYLQDLGVTAVELLPVFAFDPFDAPPGKTNYWGYSPLSFFSPHPFYSSDQDPLGPLDEFRDMVRALHRHKIEVILDVAYNHTTENGEDGPTLCFRGLDNPVYYILERDQRRYVDYSGCGNTLNANHPIVRRMIQDSLRYWVSEMHVDGFRFDLAAILSRDENGVPLANPPILLDIESDPILAGTKLIAEAWDSAGLYQVGSFVGDFWKEWNGRFRDDIRSWVRADENAIQRFPARLLASPDLFEHENRESEQSVNFVTCHDGFTLNDLVSYNTKHNEANGQGNRDGADHNISWNHGVEGPSDDPDIDALREREIKNFFAYTLLSLGTPMLLMGDEIRRTQHGNNNAFCQDNELSWFDWSQVDQQVNLRRFVRKLVRFRLRYGFDLDEERKTLAEDLREANITWHGVHVNQPDWSHSSHSLALTVSGDIPLNQDGQSLTHMIFNAFWSALDFELPPLPAGTAWRLLLDTGLPPPEDIHDRSQAPAITAPSYRASPRSVVVFVADT